MNETPKYVKEVQQILANIHENGNGNQDTEPDKLPPPENEIDMYVEEDRITLIPRRLHGIPVSQQDIVDSDISGLDTTPLPAKPAQQPTSNAAIGVLLFGLLITIFCIAFQLYLVVNPFTVTVTLDEREQQVSLQGTLQLGRILNPITLSESQAVHTTGHGHQDARSATGTVTFYNGQLSSVFIPAGTILTGSSGEQIITDHDANIPAESGSIPPTLGQTTVPAHALTPGSKGNIPLGDINQGCCATAIKAVNTIPFSGGQDERNFQTVAKSDITDTAAPLKATLAQSVQGALQGQLKTNESLVAPSCTTTTSTDHQPGEEAAQVKITVSETCMGVAANQNALNAKVTDLLKSQAAKQLGSGYSIFGSPQITITGVSISKQVMLSFTSMSTWVYALSSAEQQTIKKIIAGKTREQAMHLLLSLHGIESASLQTSGFGDDTRLPKDKAFIHIVLIAGL